MVMYEDPEAHTVDFVGSIPTPSSSAPHADESWAQFVLINFKPWINDMAELLADDHGGTHSELGRRSRRLATRRALRYRPAVVHDQVRRAAAPRSCSTSSTGSLERIEPRSCPRRVRTSAGSERSSVRSDMDTHEAAHNQQHTADDSRDVLNFMHQLAYETSESNANNARRTRERQCLGPRADRPGSGGPRRRRRPPSGPARA